MYLYSVFSKPNSFPYLTKLSLNGTPIDNEDLCFVSHLPSLRKLSIAKTRIKNKACVFSIRLIGRMMVSATDCLIPSIAFLLPLQNTLTSLSIANNGGLTDDCCEFLCFFTGLSYLDIFGTRISISGLRRIVRDLPSFSRIEVNLTIDCFEYLNGESFPIQL